MLPDRDKEKFMSSEEKIRRLELKEAKENLWRWRWRRRNGRERSLRELKKEEQD